MENIHAPRILRADIEEFEPDPPPLSKRRQIQRDRILALAPRLLARRGTDGMTLANLALALDLSTSALRRHVIDIHYLLYKILLPHLHAILSALDAIAATEPDRQALCRAAYLAATRSGDGKFLPVHTLLVRDSLALPADLLETIEALRGEILEACGSRDVMALLDKEHHTEASVETRLARIQRARAALKAHARPPAEPAPPPRPANFFTAAWVADVLAGANCLPPGAGAKPCPAPGRAAQPARPCPTPTSSAAA